MAVLWGRVMLGGSGVPVAAVASVSAAAPGAAVAEERAIRSAGAADALQEWLRSPIVPARRNLFAIKLDYYPQDGTQVDRTLRPPQGERFWDQVAKSLTRESRSA